jgi:hypothetical protein
MRVLACGHSFFCALKVGCCLFFKTRLAKGDHAGANDTSSAMRDGVCDG